MPGLKVYPGIAPNSVEYFYRGLRVQPIRGLPHDEDVHSVYECTENTPEEGTVKCPFVLTIRMNTIKEDELQGNYVRIGRHRHDPMDSSKLEGAFFRSIMYTIAQKAHPANDLNTLFTPMDHLMGTSTEDERRQLFEALEGQRRDAGLRGGVVKWNCIPVGIPSEVLPKVYLNNLGTVALDRSVVQLSPEQRKCRLCNINPACVAVLGCGHLCFCYGCAADMRMSGHLERCPRCRGQVLDDKGFLQMQFIS